MLSLHACKLLANLVIEKNGEHALKVSGSDTHMCQYVRIVSWVQYDDSLHVGWNFFFSCDLINKKNCPSVISLVHDVS